MRYTIPESEIAFEFTRAGGPGGQHVNRVLTAVQLRFNVEASDVLPTSVKQRLVRLAGKRMTSEGVLIIEAHNHRTQARNRAEAVERLQELVDRAATRPKPRRPTRPTRAAKERRLASKHQRGGVKRLRQDKPGDE